MTDPFLEAQWRELVERLQRCAHHIAGGNPSLAADFAQQAAKFADADPPVTYPIYLRRVREAAERAVEWQERRAAAATVSKAKVSENGWDEARSHSYAGDAASASTGSPA